GVGPAGLLPRLLELVLGDLGGEVPAPGQGPQHVAQLGGAVQLPAQVTTGGAMVQLGLDLLDPEPGGQRVDGQGRLHTPAGRERGARWMPGRAVRTPRPMPPAPSGGGSSAMAMSTPSPRTASTRGCAAAALSPMSASRNSRARGMKPLSSITGSGPVWPGSRGSACSSSTKPAAPSARSAASRIWTICAPVAIAAALPRLLLWRTTTASAPMATAAVASLEPSSTTTTRSTPAIERAEAMVFSIRCSSFLAGITTA